MLRNQHQGRMSPQQETFFGCPYLEPHFTKILYSPQLLFSIWCRYSMSRDLRCTPSPPHLPKKKALCQPTLPSLNLNLVTDPIIITHRGSLQGLGTALNQWLRNQWLEFREIVRLFPLYTMHARDLVQICFLVVSSSYHRFYFPRQLQEVTGSKQFF